ncbi:MAG: hypothetical protein V3R92_01250 [Dehalococcoidales bacterium]
MTRTAAAKPKIYLLARVSKVGNASQLVEDIDGADGLLINLPKADANAMKMVAEATGDIPWGWRLENSPGEIVKMVLKGGADFIVFPSDAAFHVPEADSTGRILEVESSLSEGMVRAINELPVDAVLATDEEGNEPALTWRHLMRYTRLAELLRKPMLVPIAPETGTGELQALWKAGIAGVVATGRIKELRGIIDQTAFPPRQRGEMGALVPHPRVETSGEIEEEEIEEEEEE